VRRCACFSVTRSSQMRVNSFSLKQITSLLEVAANKSCGKASSDSGLRLNMSRSRQPETILNTVTIRNLIRLAGTSLSYWSPRIYDQVATWLEFCVQNFNQENTGTALQREDYKTQEPKFNRLKNRKNLRTTGFNLYNSCYKGKRSVHNTLCIKEGTQANEPFVNCCRSLTTTIRLNNLNERVLITKLKHMVEKCKEKDGRYGNLIQIIGSLPIIKLAYLMVKSNLGISAQGVDISILDGINLKDLNKISQDTLSGKFKFSPVRHVIISKAGKTELRLLGVINTREKIIQKAIEMIITFVFEKVFLDCSHGFRPGHSCHTALKHIQLKVNNASTYSWVIEGDIKECFNNISHDMILKGLKRKINCPATFNLIKRILSAGYILNEDLKKVGRKNSKVYKSNIGITQVIVLSPLFSNIALHELDEFINHELKKEFSMGKQQKPNLIYRRLRYRIKRENDLRKRRVLINNCLKVLSKNFHDSDYKRLFYVRYADDWVILVAGSLKDAEIICNKVSDKLQSLGLTLNIKKTHITSLRKSKCRFLGIDFFIRRNIEKHHKLTKLVKKNTTIRQRFAPRIILHAPIFELLTKLKEKGFVKRSNHGEFFPKGKSNCIPLTHPQILNYFNNCILGILNYYSCVHNRNELWSIVRFLNYSCALTLARKYKLKSLAKTFKKFGRNLEFVNKKGKKYKIFRPDNLRMLPMNGRFKVNENTDIDKLLNQTLV
jgi:group II intron reverse transcriptase/maturase